ncbi:MAG: uroporphyrinogen-III synthase [Bacteroidia bacterium]|nr:uroporphyrinogen-III synthase [Bacteroidia bacterium]
MCDLHNKILISTQPTESFPEFEKALNNSGAIILNFPMISVTEAEITEQEKNTILNIYKFNWLIFTSKNGVQFFLKKHFDLTGKKELPKNLKTAVIGKKTANEFIKNGIKPSYISESNLAEIFSTELKENIIEKNSNVLLLLGNLAGDLIEETLKNYAITTRIDCYENSNPKTVDLEIIKKIKYDEYDLIIFTSSSCFSNFAETLKNHGIKIKNLRVVSIGKSTTNTMNEYGVKPVITAKQSNIEGIVQEIKTYYKPKS